MKLGFHGLFEEYTDSTMIIFTFYLWRDGKSAKLLEKFNIDVSCPQSH